MSPLDDTGRSSHGGPGTAAHPDARPAGEPPRSAPAATAAGVARERVRAVGDSPEARYALAGEFYRAAEGPARRERRRYGRAELSFLRWEITRGVLNDPRGNRPGSPWWRAVNDRLLRDKAEADLLERGLAGGPTGRGTELWLEFIAAPSAARWYRAHNASIVTGYLESRSLAERESFAERFMMNVALLRVLYAHALVAEPRLALGVFGPLGPVLADPRCGSVGFFLDLRRSFPEGYPLTGTAVEKVVADRAPIARALDGIIAPRIRALYLFAAGSLGIAAIGSLIDDDVPCYAWPAGGRALWPAPRAGRLVPRLTALATGAGFAQSG